MIGSDSLSLGEGKTTVLPLRSIAKQFGLAEIFAKAEWINPTGSYKDRIAIETIRDALRCGHRGWIGTSSGNGGASMSAYGARAGMQGFLCVAADAPKEKLQSIVPYGTRLLPMSNIGMREMDMIKVLAAEFNLKLAVTAYRYNPEGMAGAETIGTELSAQGEFTHIYVPTGGGGLLAAIARGMSHQAGKAPKIICAQPLGCGPIARFINEEISSPHIEKCQSDISGLQLPSPPDGLRAADAVRNTGGWGCLVTDDEAWYLQDQLAQHEGVFVEPASALAVAGIVNDFRAGRLTTSDRPVAILTGSGLKDLGRFTQHTSGKPKTSSFSDLRTVLESALSNNQVRDDFQSNRGAIKNRT